MTFRERLVIRVFALWTIWVWGTRIWNTIGDPDHSFGFKAVHVALALVSVVLAVATWIVLSRSRRREREKAATAAAALELSAV
ncbi:MAG TPA: hypothetical protein VM345_03600 [Acidimicrobiales bacterium]|jgi:hypothetical protein|nr:hypothetical protein [Acidimicrobiales bacterium]